MNARRATYLHKTAPKTAAQRELIPVIKRKAKKDNG